MSRTMHHKLLKSITVAGGLGQSAVIAHGGVDADSGFLAIAVHEWLHAAGNTPLTLLGLGAAFAVVLFIARPGRRASRGGPR